jgi:hypothetical protein
LTSNASGASGRTVGTVLITASSPDSAMSWTSCSESRFVSFSSVSISEAIFRFWSKGVARAEYHQPRCLRALSAALNCATVDRPVWTHRGENKLLSPVLGQAARPGADGHRQGALRRQIQVTRSVDRSAG